ncbi:hypothetical protein RUM44_002375 [Polyplax serrata]|uniref:Uncharacterized protein n=1 Tax=Polyplax serrata TaxID=468196 RepID=A0ABR1APG7_POLSC
MAEFVESNVLYKRIQVAELDLQGEPSSRPDLIFIRKHGPEIFTTLYESLELPNNTSENYYSIYTTIALITVELISEETMMDLIRLLLSIQDMTITSTSFTSNQKAQIHSLIISVFVLIPAMVHIPCLLDYAESVIQIRRRNYRHLLPESGVDPETSPITPSTEAFLDLMQITERLKSSGFDVAKLLQTPSYAGGMLHRHSWVESGFKTSVSDLNACPTEVDSVSSSPGLQKKYPEEALTFEYLKKIMSESTEVKKAADEEKRTRITKAFRSASFQELIRSTQSKSELQNKLHEILREAAKTEEMADVPMLCREKEKPRAYEVLFPELFLY